MHLRLTAFATAVVALLFVAPPARACTNDTDCPVAFCGGQVCSWKTGPHVCLPAGTDPGWCTVTTDCKCASSGATCIDNNCTFTAPPSEAGVTDAAADATDDGSANLDATSTDASVDVAVDVIAADVVAADTAVDTTVSDTSPAAVGSVADTSTVTDTLPYDASTTGSSPAISGCATSRASSSSSAGAIPLAIAALAIAGVRRRRIAA
ncbi:MAG: hypothetical protein ACHREM_03355 [Polyangiales bacterium]